MAESGDEVFTAWMADNLAWGADVLGVRLTGEPVFGWRLRSVGAAANRERPYWLRVVTEDPRWLPGDFWTGNADASAIVGVHKPLVVETTEWPDSGWQRQVRAELMSWMPGRACSATDALRRPLTLDPGWWAELEAALAVIRSTPTGRTSADAGKVCRNIHDAFGVDVAVHQRTTVHGDLHWGNLLAEPFGLLDWELWGSGPAGLDEATLYCHSLLVPDVARNVRDAFAEVLDSPSGRVAQLYASARILRRAAVDYPDLADPVRGHAERLLGR